jgi:hypothetical protein
MTGADGAARRRGTGDDAAELAEVAAQYPDHLIWREASHDGVRYNAEGLSLLVHPYAVWPAAWLSCVLC